MYLLLGGALYRIYGIKEDLKLLIQHKVKPTPVSGNETSPCVDLEYSISLLQPLNHFGLISFEVPACIKMITPLE